MKTTSSGLLADEIVIEPKQPTNPAGKPGVGGLAAIPGIIGTVIGAEDFCSVWNFPLSAVCIADPDDPERHAIPAWCPMWSDGPLCNDDLPLNETDGTFLPEKICFDANYIKVACPKEVVTKCYLFLPGTFQTRPDDDPLRFVPCDWVTTCYSTDGIPVSCNLTGDLRFISEVDGKTYRYINTIADNGKCTSSYYGNWGECFINFDVQSSPTPKAVYQFDQYMRVVDTKTLIPITNDEYEGGYPMNAVYPPEPEPEPVLPFDPGPNPFNPTLPIVPEGEECAGLICECIALVVNALGAVNNTLLKIDESVLFVVAAVQDKIIEFPQGEEVVPEEVVPFDDKAIIDKLTAILKSIDDISVEVTKEAGTNFWDVLGGAFGDIFDLIEFLIEKVIYLVVPEDTSNINEAFETLNGLISTKMKPVEQVKTAIDGAMNVEAKTFEDIYITLPTYGEVKFFETDYIQIALPYVRRILSAMMILMTAFYAYRKVSSEMIR